MISFSFSGTSHGIGYTGTICGIPKGVSINIDNINNALASRKGGFGRSSRQTFVDKVIFVGHQSETQFVTDGNDLTFTIANKCVETRPNITAVRTGHADLVGTIRHPELTSRDIAEIASARSSVCYVVLGCICEQILRDWNITTNYHVKQIGSVVAKDHADSNNHTTEPFPCLAHQRNAA